MTYFDMSFKDFLSTMYIYIVLLDFIKLLLFYKISDCGNYLNLVIFSGKFSEKQKNRTEYYSTAWTTLMLAMSNFFKKKKIQIVMKCD